MAPQDLSFNDMARIMIQVLCKTIRFQEVPEPVASLMQQRSSAAVARSLDIFAEVDQGIYEAEPHTLETTTPITVRRWCEKVLRPAVGDFS
jgi:hypothetical protein